MAPQPAPGTGTAPTGNALTDASSQLAVDPVQAAAAINTVNLQQAATASDCLWPPSGQITVPIIPGLLHQSVQIPCLLTYSEARALAAAGLIFGGLLIVWGGVGILVGGEVFPLILGAVGARVGIRGRRAKAPAKAEKEPAAEQTKADVTEAA